MESNIKINYGNGIVKELDPGDQVRIYRHKSRKYLENTQAWQPKHFFKGCTDELRKVMPDLLPYEKVLLFSVIPYIGYQDCCLKHDNGNTLSFDDIFKLSGISQGQCSKNLKSLIDKNIIYKEKDGSKLQYFINPWLFSKGNRIKKALNTMFKDYQIRSLESQKWGDIGNIQ
jgi:hypothetical protein